MKNPIVKKIFLANTLLLVCFRCIAWDVGLSTDEDNHLGMNLTVEKQTMDSVEEETVQKPGIVKPHSSDLYVFQKAQAKLTDEELPVAEYRRAMHYLNKGEEEHAVKILEDVVTKHPEHQMSRNKLADIYLKLDRLIDAEIILTDGLRIDEYNPEHLQLLAMVHDRNQEPEKALAFLTRVKESHRKDKTYLSLLGHLYQETGHYSLARQQYFKLIEKEPNNYPWLFGLSVALDHEGQKSQALEMYQKILSEGNVDLKVMNYVKDRVKKLKG